MIAAYRCGLRSNSPVANRGEEIVKLGEGNKRRENIASSGGALVADHGGESIRLWWQVWCWPAALLAGVVLWLALVAIAGAATPVGSRSDGAGAPAAVALAQPVNACALPFFSMPLPLRIAPSAGQGHCGLRTGFTPRRP
jgi:hypothetical protein